MTTVTLRPNAAGALTQLLPKTAPNWGEVDEAVADSDTSYVEHDEGGVSGNCKADLYDIPTSAIPAGSTINSVTIYHTDKKIQVGTAIVTSSRTALRSNDTNSWGVAHAITTSYVEWSEAFALNPVTFAAWTLDEINALQIGVSLQFQYIGDTRYSYARSTQVYVVIDYSPPVAAAELQGDGLTLWT